MTFNFHFTSFFSIFLIKNHFAANLSPPKTTIPRKRRTHKRSSSDTDVKTTTLVNSFAARASINDSNKIVEINEEDFVEGYEEGPSYRPTHVSFLSTKKLQG
jgi:hypothetical protein